MRVPRISPTVAVLFFCAVLCSIYLPRVGLGFVKDDVVWIQTSRISGFEDLRGLLVAKTGFFRPVVSASFALDYAAFGSNPRGYGITNLGLLFACIASIAFLVRSLGMHRCVAIGGGLVWAFNFHGVNMAVLWVSGRTALWLCLWFALAAAGFARHARGWPVLAAALAMMSKEEGFVLPAVLTVWAWIDAAPYSVTARAATTLKRTWAYWVAAALLLLVRANSGAMTPWNAPSHYTYQTDVGGILRNVLEYADRSMTAPLSAILLLWLCLGSRGKGDLQFRDVWRGVTWLALAFAPTILLPGRSSLYALLPTIGVIVAFTSVADLWVRKSSSERLRLAGMTFAIASILLWPIYTARTDRYAGEARLSAQVMSHVADIANERGPGLVVVNDIRDTRPTAEQAFGTLAAESSALLTNGQIQMWIDPPPRDLAVAGEVSPPALPVVGEIRVEGGRAERVW